MTKLRPSGFPDVPVFRRRARAPEALTWAEDLAGRRARLTCAGDRLLVENHEGILEVGARRVVLATGQGPLTVEGDQLALCEVRRGGLIVRGVIRRIELPCREGGEPR